MNKVKVIKNINKDTKIVDLDKYSIITTGNIHKKDILCGKNGHYSTPEFWDFKWKTVENWLFYNKNIVETTILNYNLEFETVYRLNSTINRKRLDNKKVTKTIVKEISFWKKLKIIFKSLSKS
jgi:hypothetical protein